MFRGHFLSALALVALLGVLVACGGGGDAPDAQPEEAVDAAPVAPAQPESSPAEPAEPIETEPPVEDGQTPQDLLDAEPGEDVAIVWGTGDLEPGPARMSFLIVDDVGELTQAPVAELVVGKIELEAEGEIDVAEIPAREAASATAVLEAVGAAPHEHDGDPLASHNHIDATDLYVAHLELLEPGLYWAVAAPRAEGVELLGIQAFGTFEVLEEAIAPTVGDQAIASDTPTLDDGSVETLTTLEPPAEKLLRHSVADSLANGVPFVVTFATPAFCQTRVCGPVVETVDEARLGYESRGIRFIQVEIYNDNDPSAGINQWVQEWGLPCEPWTFLVGPDGVIRERFERDVAAGARRGDRAHAALDRLASLQV
jgi:hypothetical protein